jgi:glutamate-1-semialdehyde 2,1-aminomutase
MPISAIVGKTEYMSRLEHVCFSGTFFGETLSLVAAIATINKMEKKGTLGHIRSLNQQIIDTFHNLAVRHGITNYISVIGERLPRIHFREGADDKPTREQIKTLFIQEMIQNGVLIIASFNLSGAFEQHHIARITSALDKTFATIGAAIREGRVHEAIKGEEISKTASVR